MGKPFINRTGMRYGRLLVQAQTTSSGKAHWRCLCDCGQITEVSASNLATGHTQSCGCLRREASQSKRRYAKEHSTEYQIWRGLKQRTGTSPGKNAQWYSGVELCTAWRDSFDQFLQDMGKRPSMQHSIERVNGALGYCPGNCIWVLPKVQANNRSSNFIIEHGGDIRTLAQWAEQTGISASTIRARLLRHGWSVQDALFIPVTRR